MKRSPRRLLLALLAAAVLLGGSCAAVDSGKVMLEFPSLAAVNLGQTDALFLTNFWQTKETKEIDLGRELRTYWLGELSARFKGPIKTPAVSFGPEAIFEDAAYWKQIAAGTARSIIMTGRFDLIQETRKSVVETSMGSVEEPFVKKKGWETRQAFTLEARLVLLAGDTGKIVLDRNYKEMASYPEAKQPPLYALYELVQRIKIKFFRDAFGAPRNQERYLLSQ